MNDTIADMIIRIANANHKFKETVEMPASKVKAEIAKVLKEEGYINHFRTVNDRKQGVLRINLKYTPEKERVIQGLRRISKSSLRVYKKSKDLPSVQNGLGIALVSTSKGIMTSEKAREQNLGGEIVCTVW